MLAYNGSQIVNIWKNCDFYYETYVTEDMVLEFIDV